MDVKQGIRQLDKNTKATLLTGKGFWKSAECVEIGLDSAILSDGPHGLRVQKSNANHLGLGKSLPATCYPTAATMACSWDTGLCEELGRHLGEEAASQGVSMLLGPGLNVKRSPLCGRNFEYFSEDSYLSGKLAAAYVRGIQQNGVVSCIKHFAVNSRENGRMVMDAVVDEQSLREIYLTGFEIAVKEGRPKAVMTAYNKLNGVYCNQNERLIGGILRGEWGFDGLVVSDWGGTTDRVAAVKAGADLEMPCYRGSAAHIAQAIERGELDERAVDACIERQYAFSVAAKNIERKSFDAAEHSDFAKKCAENSLVLLKNENRALPLDNKEKVALIGQFAQIPRYQGAGSSQVNPTSLDNMRRAMEQSGLNYIGYERGFHRYGKASRRLIARAVKLAKRADTLVVCLGLDEKTEAEGADRKNISFPENQVELLSALSALGKKIVVVLSCGSPVDMDWEKYCDGILHCYLSGQSGAAAAVDALSGRINPSGRLAESYPYRLSDVPCAEIYDNDAYKSDYAEGIYVGYKYYDTFGVAVRYPFGYGLSYTDFEFSGCKVDPSGATVTVKNTGERDGATVIQVYVRAPRALIGSPSELKAFKKVFLRAGEERETFIPFDEYAFRTWNEESNSWQKGGIYAVSIGENSRDIAFTQDIIIEGDCGNGESSDGGKIGFKEYFDSRISPAQPPRQYKKGELVATPMTEVNDLKYCRGAVAKIFYAVACICSHSKDVVIANSMTHLPLRFLAVFLHMDAVQTDGFMDMCNGKFFRGLRKIVFKK
ncbi:MAG: glycoside hydrolase family 3 C-terminal domain-containing protein [Candidatus Coproplasma sp.]